MRKITKAPVEIGRYAVLGTGAVVLPGGSLGEGSVVGALSLVTKPLEPWGVYFGIPVKRLKGRARGPLAFEAAMMAEKAALAEELVSRADRRNRPKPQMSEMG